jgi:phosphatidylinositol alpha-1,6-mannosyltransferase
MRSILDHVPDAHYLIAGDGPYKDTLQKMARDLGVQDRVTFAGFVPDDELPEWYSATDLFVMISREITARGDVEGFGIVYLEASAAGQAIVAGDSGGVPDAVEEGMGGILVPPNDAVALAATLSRVLGDPELRRSMASAGRRRIQDRFTPDRGHGEMLEVMHEVARAG